MRLMRWSAMRPNTSRFRTEAVEVSAFDAGGALAAGNGTGEKSFFLPGRMARLVALLVISRAPSSR